MSSQQKKTRSLRHLCMGNAEHPGWSHVPVQRMLVVRILTFVMDKEKKEEGEGERKEGGKKGTEEKKQLRIT